MTLQEYQEITEPLKALRDDAVASADALRDRSVAGDVVALVERSHIVGFASGLQTALDRILEVADK